MEKEKVFFGLSNNEADYLLSNLKSKNFQVNRVNANGSSYVAVNKVDSDTSLLTLSALVLEVFKDRVVTDALSDMEVNSDVICDVINSDCSWGLLSEDTISVMYSYIYKKLSEVDLMEISFEASKYYANQRSHIYPEVKKGMGVFAL